MGNVAQLNTTPYNWGEALKADVNDVTLVTNNSNTGNAKGPITPGKYAAFLQEVKHGTFKKGSYGLTFTYVIESGASKNRKIREYLVLKKADGTAMTFGAERMKKRLLNFGMPLEKINAFKGPRNEHDLGDFKLVLGAAVTIDVAADADYEGKPSRKVKAVYPRAIEE